MKMLVKVKLCPYRAIARTEGSYRYCSTRFQPRQLTAVVGQRYASSALSR